METVITTRRKLIDIPSRTFDTLNEAAARKSISLKRYIENLLEQEAGHIRLGQRDVNPAVLRLLGSARPNKSKLAEIEDERLRYILSK